MSPRPASPLTRTLTRTLTRALTLAPALALAIALACTPAQEDDAYFVEEILPDTVAVADSAVFDYRVAVFLLADSARMAEIRARYDESDYGVVGDDMMWYRAEAWSWFEDRAIPISAVEGRPSLRFRVDGATVSYDFSDAPTADVVVLYEPDRAPRAVAPIDVGSAAPRYFTNP